MNAEYSPDSDALVIHLRRGRPAYGEDIGDGIIVHYDKNRTPVEIEILEARSHLARWVEKARAPKRRAIPA
ncbi:MAG: DUF2283 domain-containing protein [Euryarchaeota archaeon]|nr:DUF2283 domain-containing protein [Euryarchaeota archaeon]